MLHDVTVIIPTTAHAKRRATLMRSIECVLAQKDVRALPLVVVNGAKYDPDLWKLLQKRKDIQLYHLEQASLPHAQWYGVTKVSTPFYAFLDDDDVYNPDALSVRLDLMYKTPEPDLVVTNVIIEKEGEQSVLTTDFTKLARNPAESLHDLIWLCSLNNLFRTSTVTADYFKNLTPYMEWTDLAIRLEHAQNIHISYSNIPTGIYYDTMQSASKTDAYLHAQIKLLSCIDTTSFSYKTTKRIQHKIATAYNMLSINTHRNGHYFKAWMYFLKCISYPTGFAYVTFGRKLILPTKRIK